MIESDKITGLNKVSHTADLCVVGGGIAGMLAAISAARHGISVILMHDRPVLGGHASSEIRMWIRGANGDNMRETGILEQLALENIYRNPTLNYSIWDSVLYEAVRFQDGLDIILNCACTDAQMKDGKITSISGYQSTTQTWHTVSATLFADCSGDSILAPLTGAKWRIGRESQAEFGESIAPKESDNSVMGMSCLFQARPADKPVKFIPPKWAYKYDKDSFPFRMHLDTPDDWIMDNYWWIEIGGMGDSIADTESNRDRLLKIVFGVWDFIKNGGYCNADNWELDWVGFLPGKRESRRYIGDYVLTQQDVEKGVMFEDTIAYGGWTLDDHNSLGFDTKQKPNNIQPSSSPYCIPYRCIYSQNIPNLFFAGRNISVSHTAFSSTRVMATCGLIGQAVGTAAAIAIKSGLTPRQVGNQKIKELQNNLMVDDCYLPGFARPMPKVMENAKVTANGYNAAVLTNGIDRPVGYTGNCWRAVAGDEIMISFSQKTNVNQVRIVFDSELNRESWTDVFIKHKRFPQRCHVRKDSNDVYVPKSLVKEYILEGYNGDKWETIYTEDNNYQRLNVIDINGSFNKIRLIAKSTWGADCFGIYAFYAL